MSFTDLDKIELKAKKVSEQRKKFVRVGPCSRPARCHAAFTWYTRCGEGNHYVSRLVREEQEGVTALCVLL